MSEYLYAFSKEFADFYKEQIFSLSSRQAYLSVLFDSNDRICAGIDAWNFSFFEKSLFLGSEQHQYVCLNALSAPKKSRKTVSKFRSFLIEFDVGTLEDQRFWVADTELPYSAAVYSGNKSLHYIVSLTRPLSEDQYDLVCAKLKKIFEGRLDPTCVNPQCFTRLPEALNKKTEKKQVLLDLWGRVDTDFFLTWLDSYNIQIVEPMRVEIVHPRAFFGLEKELGLEALPFEVWQFMNEGYTKQNCVSRHHTLLVHMGKLKARGYTKTQVESYLYKPFVETNVDKTAYEFHKCLDWIFNQEE